ncbi:dienelactone hydrolase family protein [Singulisphaera sp. PoT]|uniref:alpha/beta hydrolase family protein n=1 Tax=Singulisphaera sp. PoT TaxID=3411797 RepID=UPI003BF5A3B6
MPHPRASLCLVLLTLSFAPPGARAQSLPGTQPWEDRGDPAKAMVDGIHRFADRMIATSGERRKTTSKPDYSSTDAYEKSVAPRREQLAKILGAVGQRVTPATLSYVSSPDSPAKVAETDDFSVFAVTWSVYPGVEAEGLWLEPKKDVRANVVALPDCDTTPEEFAGVGQAHLHESQAARLLVKAGCRVLVPTLLDRSDTFSGNPSVRMTNLTHREWIYRQSYETGRHIIGYEVDKVRSAIDWFSRPGRPDLPIGLVGYGEGGLVAFYAGALDTRADAVWVGGYFGPRESAWSEPIYRNVWSLLTEFGDAEAARLILPRKLVVEPAAVPDIKGPPRARDGRADAASGRLTTPEPAAIAAEFARLQDGLPAEFRSKASLLEPKSPAPGFNHADEGRKQFLLALLPTGDAKAEGQDTALNTEKPLFDARPHFDTKARMKRQVQQLSDYTQAILRTSELRRYAYWAPADMKSPEAWAKSTEAYREAFHAELIGKLPPASEPLSAKTVKLFDTEMWVGYGVQLPVWPDVPASGILLLPKDLQPGEKRPVVVCQHGLEGRPEDVVDPKIKSVYHSYAAQLADKGYVVYAPQNPYIGHDHFRLIQRKLNPLKASLFSVIVRQHERTLEWLATLPNVDPSRIAFYGLSYGGKTAMRVPAILKGYCLSICSADFNEWVVKNTNLERPTSYMFTIEYDMYEFGLAERFNYAEMANLIAPRPFQVERGHSDAVGYDEWIGYEYMKVKRTFDTLGLADRVDIALFNGGHQIEGTGTFPFLARHLNWPRGR